MKILYDHQMFSLQKYGGITKYFCELIKNLPKDYQYKLPLLLTDNQHLEEDNNYFKKWIVTIPDRDFKGKGFLKNKIYTINKLYSERFISKNNYDLLHPTYYDNYFFNNLKKPYVITVHDLIAFKFNGLLFKDSKIKPQMERVIKNANRVIAISEYTKNDIIEILNVPASKIDVIYHGYNKNTKSKKTKEYTNYILFVGSRDGYKNFNNFVKAISYLFSKERDLRLICVGKPFDKEEISNLKDLRILERSTVINGDENKLSNLYFNALAFVYPSLYEGFGMPILESFTNNCPVCLSNSSCFPEIAADGGSYFDPYNPESILAAIEKILYNDDFRNQLICNGKKRLFGFSWEKTAIETCSTYEKAIISYKKDL